MLVDRYNDAGDRVKIDDGDADALAVWSAKGYAHESKPDAKPAEKPKPDTSVSKKKFKHIKASDAPAKAQPFPSEEDD